MSIVYCAECEGKVSSRVETCPHCGHPLSESPPCRETQKSKPSPVGFVVLIVIVTAILAFIIKDIFFSYQPDPKAEIARQAQQNHLIESVSYLMEAVDEIKWVEVVGNNVYIGFEPLPNDWKFIINAAALKGNLATDFGCHVWAIKAARKGWRPGDGPYYGETTARYGKIQP